MYWAEELVKQTDNMQLRTIFDRISIDLINNEDSIIAELNNAQGVKEDIKGYYFPDIQNVISAMRPSVTFNNLIDRL